jgi:hypothetical protein
MLAWVHDFPVWLTYIILLISFVGFSILGAFSLRPVLRSVLSRYTNRNDILDPTLGYLGVIFGILIGSLAITSHQNQSAAQDAIMKEAASVAILYRNFSLYPEPKRAELQASLREYARYVVEEELPAKQKGVVLTAGASRIAAITRALGSFEPQTKGQELTHAQTLSNFSEFVSTRRFRLFSAFGNIPNFFWFTLFMGWLLSLVLLWMFDVSLVMHVTVGVILSTAMATLVCLISLMDYPFRGEFSVAGDAIRLGYEQMMRSNR